MTVQQFAQMETPDTEDYELVDGEPVFLPSRTYGHNRLRGLIGHLLWIYFKGNPIGEAVARTDCQTAPDTVRRPDLSIFLGERLQHIDIDTVRFLSRRTSRLKLYRPTKPPSACAAKSAIIWARAAGKYGCWTTPTPKCWFMRWPLFGFSRERMFWNLLCSRGSPWRSPAC